MNKIRVLSLAYMTIACGMGFALAAEQPMRKEFSVEEALALKTEGRTDDAIAALERIVQHRNDDYEALLALGSTYLEIGQHKKALRNYRKAAWVKPKDHRTKYSLAMVYGKLGKHEKAIRNWESYLARNDISEESRSIAQKQLEQEKEYLKQNNADTQGRENR